MSTDEAVPGMAHKIRTLLTRRSPSIQARQAINALTTEQIYAQANPSVLDAVAKLKPTDATDFAQWTAFQEAVATHLNEQELNQWIRNIRTAHQISGN